MADWQELAYQSVLVTGEMRSGTTFLANLLNRQEGVRLLADVTVALFVEAHKLGVIDIDAPLSLRQQRVLLNNLAEEGRYRGLAFNRLSEADAGTWFEAFSRALNVIRQPGDRVVGVKRTREREFIEQLLLRGVRVVFIVRDPRDVLLSARDRFGEYDLFRFADSWRESVSKLEGWKHLEGFAWLRFEDLVLRENGALEALSESLGVEVRPDDSPEGFDGIHASNSSFGDVSRPFDRTAVARWKARLEEPEVLFASDHLGDEIRALGYEPYEPGVRADLRQLRREYRRRCVLDGLKAVARRALG